MSDCLQSRRLYIPDLARRQYEMESGHVAMHPLAYQVLSKRLRQALAGLPESSTRACFSEVPAHLLPLVAEMVEARHFDHHGLLFGIGAAHCRDLTETLVGRLKSPSTR